VIRLLRETVEAGTTVIAGSHDLDLVGAADCTLMLTGVNGRSSRDVGRGDPASRRANDAS
jgi:ABC-type ATPase involved in cell division